MLERNLLREPRKAAIGSDEYLMRHLRGLVCRHVATHYFEHMLTMPGDQLRKLVDLAMQDPFDNLRIIGHESLHSCAADFRCRAIEIFRIIPYLSLRPQELAFPHRTSRPVGAKGYNPQKGRSAIETDAERVGIQEEPTSWQRDQDK